MIKINGNKIRGARNERRLTQIELAELAKVSERAVRKAELPNDQAGGDAIEIARIATVLGLSINDVIIIETGRDIEAQRGVA